MEKDLLALFLPTGLGEYFKVAGIDKSEGSVIIVLEEHHAVPLAYSKQKLTS